MKIYYSAPLNALVLVKKINKGKWKYRLCTMEYYPFRTTSDHWEVESNDYVFIGEL